MTLISFKKILGGLSKFRTSKNVLTQDGRVKVSSQKSLNMGGSLDKDIQRIDLALQTLVQKF